MYSGDSADYWYSNIAAGSTVDIYLDGTSLDKGAIANMYEGNSLHSLMRHVQEGIRSGTDTTLNTPPVYVSITELYSTSNPGAYTFCLYKN
ncbi:hypothetical protein [Methanosarcina acetivorans]|uniref:Uncharacterized protein n=1 Tax=Methanosarcina acetivorans (strain ATCC 35395 / DSM 2834 / JCM 12185 / C2A) TaxID=188937 RepID=Q8TQK1_METAC|nr:hypothetical protein [Methanosarcina acetivorans]AAM04955.1 predicted protein [Methanosarcina acetivorans C2A]